jgi:hypothetical protein
VTLANTANAILVIPSGEVYFDRFVDETLVGEGELYLGNTPGFKVSRTFEETKRYSSYAGQVIERDAIVTQEKNSADIETDNISMDNISLWFGGTVSDAGQAAVGLVSESFQVRRGRWYQLGSSINTAGVRYVEPGVSFSVDSNPITNINGNFVVNRSSGRIFVLNDAVDVIDGQELTVTFQWRAAEGSFVIPSGQEVVGALRFIATNEIGPKISYLFPYVRLRPKSDIDLKAETFMSLQFDVDIRKKFGTSDFVYVTAIGDPTYNADELSIINIGLVTLEDFVTYEDLFDSIMNDFIPSAING